MPKKKQNGKSKNKKAKKRNYNTMIANSEDIANIKEYNKIEGDSQINSKKEKTSNAKLKDIFNFNFDFDNATFRYDREK